MSLFFFVLAVLAMLSVLAVLFTGIIGMIRGGEFNAKWGNKLMRLRVALQALALVLLLLTAWAFQHSH